MFEDLAQRAFVIRSTLKKLELRRAQLIWHQVKPDYKT
jgi:hypothetical protein